MPSRKEGALSAARRWAAALLCVSVALYSGAAFVGAFLTGYFWDPENAYGWADKAGYLLTLTEMIMVSALSAYCAVLVVRRRFKRLVIAGPLTLAIFATTNVTLLVRGRYAPSDSWDLAILVGVAVAVWLLVRVPKDGESTDAGENQA